VSAFSDAELAYLRDRRMGRLATSDAAGQPHVVPIGMWRYNAELDTIDVTGRDFAKTRKFRNVQANPQAAFVIDDMASIDPWRPRSVLVMGPAVALPDDPSSNGSALIRITPAKVVSWGLDAG